ncbi:MAG: hypothetical protein ACLPND_21330 [Candidatus Korobacteraceae bacterium]
MKPVKHCRHVKEDGIACGSPALRGQSYCHFHLRYKGYPLRAWPNKGRLGGWRLTRRTAFNLKAAEANLKRVEKMLASGTCSDAQRAGLIRYALQMMVSNLRYMQGQG